MQSLCTVQHSVGHSARFTARLAVPLAVQLTSRGRDLRPVTARGCWQPASPAGRCCSVRHRLRSLALTHSLRKTCVFHCSTRYTPGDVPVNTAPAVLSLPPARERRPAGLLAAGQGQALLIQGDGRGPYHNRCYCTSPAQPERMPRGRGGCGRNVHTG